MPKPKADVSTAADVAVLANRIAVLELALVTISEDNDYLMGVVDDLEGRLCGADRDVEDLRGRIDELEGEVEARAKHAAFVMSNRGLLGPAL